MTNRKRPKRPPVVEADQAVTVDHVAIVEWSDTEASLRSYPRRPVEGVNTPPVPSLADLRRAESEQLIESTVKQANHLADLIADLRAVPQWRARKYERLLRSAVVQANRYTGSLRQLAGLLPEGAVPVTAPEWLVVDLTAARNELKTEQAERALAQDASEQRAADLRRSKFSLADEDSFQEFAKRFIYDR